MNKDGVLEGQGDDQIKGNNLNAEDEENKSEKETAVSSVGAKRNKKSGANSSQKINSQKTPPIITKKVISKPDKEPIKKP